MTFRDEKDLRQWVGQAFPEVFWIEPARGSTIGFPDCMIACHEHRGRPIFLELKCGPDIAPGKAPSLRPMQHVQLRRLNHLGFQAGVLWAVEGTSKLLVFPAARLFRGVNQVQVAARALERGGWKAVHFELLAVNGKPKVSAERV